MNMKNILSLILLISAFVQAQVYEVEYETQIHITLSEQAISEILGVSDSEKRFFASKYENTYPYLYKFIFNEYEANAIEDEKIFNSQGESFVSMKAPYLSNGFLYLNENKMENYFHFDEGVKYNVASKIQQVYWDITKDEKELLGYKVIKANTEFEGKKITAWFTPLIKTKLAVVSINSPNGLILELKIDEIDKKGSKFSSIYQARNVKFNKNGKIKYLKKGKDIDLEIFVNMMNDLYKKQNEYNDSKVDTSY